MATAFDPYRQQPPALPLMSQNERLLAPKPAPQGELRPWDSKIANAGAYIEDKAMMPNLGKAIQNAGQGSNEGIRPDQLVRAGTEIGMLAPQVGATARTVGTAAKTLPALYQAGKQGFRAALPELAKAIPAIGNAAIETTSLAAGLTGNHEMGDLSNAARFAKNGLQSATMRRDLDIGRNGVADRQQFGRERDMLASALRMARNGEQNMERIRQQTGWRTLPAPEGGKQHWAMEIPDDKARLIDGAGDGYLAGQLNHPALFDHYPDAAFIQRSANPNMGAARGKVNQDGTKMQWNPNHPDMMSEVQQRENATHEIQHWIQNREGWPRGGNPQSPAVQDAANAQMEDLFANGFLKFDMPVNDIMKKQQDLANNAYWNLAGEAQARAAANRMQMTAQQRQQLNPMDHGYDRGKDELVYQY